MTLEIPTDPKDLQQVQSVVLQAFNIPPQHWPKVLFDVGEKNFRIVRSEGKIVGALGLYVSDQWFGGKPLTSQGVACVSTALAHRRRGHGRRLMEGLLGEQLESGIALSTLYPSTDSFYQKLGYGYAGDRVVRTLSALPDIQPDGALPICELDPTLPADFEDIQRLHLERARRGNGAFSRNRGLWSRLIRRANAAVRVFGLGPREALEGWVCTAQLQGSSPYPLLFTDIVALSPAAVRHAWILAGLHAPTAGELRWVGSGRDALALRLPDSDWQIRHRKSWMLRIVNLKAALEGRGYPMGMNGQLVLEIDDPLVKQNSGRWTLKVSEGQGQLAPGGTGGLTLNIQAMATLFSGYHSAADLSGVGLLSGDSAAIQTADLLFAGPEPYCPDVF